MKTTQSFKTIGLLHQVDYPLLKQTENSKNEYKHNFPFPFSISCLYKFIFNVE